MSLELGVKKHRAGILRRWNEKLVTMKVNVAVTCRKIILIKIRLVVEIFSVSIFIFIN